MSKWPENIIRTGLHNFHTYGARGASTDALHLDANESPWTPPPSNLHTSGYNRYPAQQPVALRVRLAELYGISPDRIMMGRGADECIEILLRTFCESGQDSILTCTPGFSFFKTAAQIQGAHIIEFSLGQDFQPDEDKLIQQVKASRPKLIFLCSPNNPTGLCLPPELVSQLCRQNRDSLIIIDEAYSEFSTAESFIDMQTTHHNLIILRTLSKAYSLAGVRLGACLADPALIDVMCRILPPYPIARPVEQAILNALTPAAMPVHASRIEQIKNERTRLYHALQNSSYIETVYTSEANFLLLKACNSKALLRQLTKYHIKIRDFRKQLPEHFRITIGSPAENDLLLNALGLEVSIPRKSRVAEVFRKTNETDIAIQLDLDGSSKSHITTGLGFFDHMLEQVAQHAGFGLTLSCQGDLEIDPHHTIEDTALALGDALRQALGNKAGIGRYGFTMPMDETQARVAVDLSGRPATRFIGTFPTDHAGAFPCEMCPHFFQSLAQTLRAAIHIEVEGENSHHMIEACFKGVGRALRPAFAKADQPCQEMTNAGIPSTKGVL